MYKHSRLYNRWIDIRWPCFKYDQNNSLKQKISVSNLIFNYCNLIFNSGITYTLIETDFFLKWKLLKIWTHNCKCVSTAQWTQHSFCKFTKYLRHLSYINTKILFLNGNVMKFEADCFFNNGKIFIYPLTDIS